MKWYAWFGALGVGLLASLPAETLGQNKVKNGEVLPATAERYAMLAKLKEVGGVLQSTAPGSITVRIQYDHPEKVPGANTSTATIDQQYQQKVNQIQQQVAKARTIKNPAQQQQTIAGLQNQLAQLQQQHAQQKQAILAKGTAMSKDFIDFELALADKATFRSLAGVPFDANGEPKNPAPKDKGAIGVAAKFEDLTKGDHVRVYLVPPTKSGPAARPQVRMVVIYKDGADTSANKKSQ